MEETDVTDGTAAGLQGLKILVVEDTFAMALALQATLDAVGCAVVGPVGRLEQALPLAQAHRLDGAILDVNLGGESVFPLARELAARGVPMIFTTGYEREVLPDAFRDSPRLEKPFDMERLLVLMRRAFVASGM